MKLYDAHTPNTLRVRVFLAEMGIDLPVETIDVRGGATRTPAFLAKNSLGEVPVLELDDGRHLTESVAICRYLEEMHPTPALFGDTTEARARIEMWNRRMELHLFASLGGVARHTFSFFAATVEQMPDYAASQMRLFDKQWAWLDDELSDGRPFIAGDALSVADITGMAVLLVCTFMEKELPADRVNAKRWAEAMYRRPSFTRQVDRAA